jgi:hypothetical protein
MQCVRASNDVEQASKGVKLLLYHAKTSTSPPTLRSSFDLLMPAEKAWVENAI